MEKHVIEVAFRGLIAAGISGAVARVSFVIFPDGADGYALAFGVRQVTGLPFEH